MQCVSNETSFSHYYTSSYKFPLLDRSIEEIQENPVSNIASSSFESDNNIVEADDQNLKYFNERSPKKIRFSEKKANRKRFFDRNRVYTENKQENVGLYRNLRQNCVDVVPDEKLEMYDQNSTKERLSKRRRSLKLKSIEQPVVWALSEMKTE